MLDRNIWKYTTMCKLFVLDRNTSVIWFNGISTLGGYSMPNSVHTHTHTHTHVFNF